MNWSARVIFCDDIRQEINGKFILIGVYAGVLATRALPISASISTYIDIRDLTSGHHKCTIKAIFETDEEDVELASLNSEIEVNDGRIPFILVGAGMTITAERPGNLKILLGIDDSELKLADTLSITTSS